ncbi:MAG: RsiV family protein [Bacteroidia bacterium]
MKIKFPVLIIFLFLSSIVGAFAQDNFYKRMEGNLGGQYVQMHITKEDSELNILYYYQIIGLPVKLAGRIEKDYSFVVYNHDDSGKISETYAGAFTENHTSLAGLWYNYDSTVQTTFAAEETYALGSSKFSIKTIRNKHYNENNRLLAEFKNRQLYIDLPENTSAQHAVNDTLIKWQYGILPRFAGAKPNRIDFERYGKFFIDSSKAEAAKKEAEDGIFINYGINSSAGVVFNESNIVCTELYNYMYVGGSRPGEFIIYSCFNTQAGKQIMLDEMFKGDYKKALTKQADKVLRLRFNIKKKNLKKSGFNMKKIALNDNYFLTPQGIVFFYNEYDVASYEMGSFPIFISYASVKSYIREDGVLNWARLLE